MSKITKKYKTRGLIAICKQAIRQEDFEKLTKYFNELKRLVNV
jgi:hypothetical protein